MTNMIGYDVIGREIKRKWGIDIFRFEYR